MASSLDRHSTAPEGVSRSRFGERKAQVDLPSRANLLAQYPDALGSACHPA